MSLRGAVNAPGGPNEATGPISLKRKKVYHPMQDLGESKGRKVNVVYR